MAAPLTPNQEVGMVNEIWEIIWNNLPEDEELDRDAVKSVSQFFLDEHPDADLTRAGIKVLIRRLYQYELWRNNGTNQPEHGG